jgi:hypothetical protein
MQMGKACTSPIRSTKLIELIERLHVVRLFSNSKSNWWSWFQLVQRRLWSILISSWLHLIVNRFNEFYLTFDEPVCNQSQQYQSDDFESRIIHIVNSLVILLSIFELFIHTSCSYSIIDHRFACFKMI